MYKDEFRATEWEDFIGQEALKNRLTTHIIAARSSGRALPHILLSGPPGFGKTSLAGIIAAELDREFNQFVCPIPEKTLFNIAIGNYGQVILLDEVHRMRKKDQEQLLPFLEDNTLYLTTGVVIDVDPGVTLVAATTERDKVIAPLYDRFMIKPEFEDYTDSELCEIVTTMAKRTGIELDSEFATAIGKASGGVPRNAKQVLIALRDYREAYGFDPEFFELLELCQIDENGLSSLHLQYIDYLRQHGSCGLNTLATVLCVPAGAVVALERMLLRDDIITYTKRGRELSRKGLQYGRTNAPGGSRS